MENQTTRLAIVTGGLSADLSTVEQYLPSNYEAKEVDGLIVIGGTDRAGWTLDGYVIPRLQSGLIVAVEMQEVTP